MLINLKGIDFKWRLLYNNNRVCIQKYTHNIIENTVTTKREREWKNDDCAF